jgi:methylated-DNA-protein-cysteine methyltransferase-like protein
MGASVLDDFDRAVERVVRAIPKGRVLSYGAVAARAGRWGGARHVAKSLRRLKGVPWWRVIRSDGTLAAAVALEQGRRLRAEGIDVRARRVVEAQKHRAPLAAVKRRYPSSRGS